MAKVVHFEIPAEDPDRAIGFYRSAFGWQISKWDGPQDYWLVATGEDAEPGINGGLYKRHQPDEPVVDTIGVASVDDACAAIERAGGQIVMPKSPIPGVGWLARFKDTEGNLFGVMQPDESAA